MGKTLEAITDRAFDEKTNYQPGELADGRFSDLTNPPSLAALKLHEVLFKAAGAAVADDRWHQIDLVTLRAIQGMKNYDRRGLVGLFRELRGVVIEYDTATETVVAGLLDIAKVEFEDGDGPTIIRWKFGEGFREIVASSNYWALIDRSASLAMTSRYALRLHQMISLRINLERKSSEVFKLDDLRGRLGVPDGKLVRWVHLSQKALQPAIEEVNQLSRFQVRMEPKKRGRSVVSVEIFWAEKSDLIDTKTELERHSVGRKARRNGEIEAIIGAAAEPAGGHSQIQGGEVAGKPLPAPLSAFPAAGGISFNGWAAIAREHLPGGSSRPDVDLVAEQFRQWATQKGISLASSGIRKTFEGFCRKWQMPKA